MINIGQSYALDTSPKFVFMAMRVGVMDNREQKKGKQRKELTNAFSFFSQVITMMAACVLVGVFLGKFLDDLLGSTPGFLIVFSLLGIAASFKAMFDLAMKK